MRANNSHAPLPPVASMETQIPNFKIGTLLLKFPTERYSTTSQPHQSTTTMLLFDYKVSQYPPLHSRSIIPDASILHQYASKASTQPLDALHNRPEKERTKSLQHMMESQSGLHRIGGTNTYN